MIETWFIHAHPGIYMRVIFFLGMVGSLALDAHWYGDYWRHRGLEILSRASQ